MLRDSGGMTSETSASPDILTSTASVLDLLCMRPTNSALRAHQRPTEQIGKLIAMHQFLCRRR